MLTPKAEHAIRLLLKDIEEDARNLRRALAHQDNNGIIRDADSIAVSARNIIQEVAEDTGDGPADSVFRGER